MRYRGERLVKKRMDGQNDASPLAWNENRGDIECGLRKMQHEVFGLCMFAER